MTAKQIREAIQDILDEWQQDREWSEDNFKGDFSIADRNYWLGKSAAYQECIKTLRGLLERP